MSGAVGHACGAMHIKLPWVCDDYNYKMPTAIAARLLKVANGRYTSGGGDVRRRHQLLVR
jgi:hypothetical protein